MRLHLLRHARAGPAAPGSDDHGRPLEPRGERDARAVGAELAARGARPQLALCSSARRAQQTLEALVAALPEPPELRVLHGLYLAGADDLLQEIRAADASVDELLVVGHNPAIAALACELVGDPAERRRLAEGYPAGAIAELEFDATDWRRIAPGSGRLRAFRTAAGGG